MPLRVDLLSFVMAILLAPTPTPSARPQPASTFPPHGGAFISSLPGTAAAWVDGTFVGSTPLYVDDLLPGSHSVTLSSAGWQPQSTDFDVAVSRVTPVSIVMTRATGDRSAKGQGLLAVVGAPPGARIYVDGVGIGVAPVQPHPEGAGYHIVTVQPPGPDAVRSTRVVNVFPNTTTAVALQQPSSPVGAPSADFLLEPVDTIVPPNSIVIAGSDVTIHYRGAEVQCAIGSRTYTFNGKPGTLNIPPALVGGRVYLPQSLLARLAGK
jgi:PEGA domain-containing protein/copper amine oxidase-like protein